MMISPEGYYEIELKGKTKKQLMTAIRGLKQEMGRLKNAMEDPANKFKHVIRPSEDTQLHCTREYLERAKLAYAEAGGTYTLSRSEEKIADFEANMDAISKMSFSFGSYFNGYPTYIVILEDELKGYKKVRGDQEAFVFFDEDGELFTKDTFIAGLRNLYIGEWRRRYSTKRFGYMVCDGTQWQLEFEYNNGHKPVKYDGDNAYPYNFDQFLELLGIS